MCGPRHASTRSPLPIVRGPVGKVGRAVRWQMEGNGKDRGHMAGIYVKQVDFISIAERPVPYAQRDQES